MRTCLKKMTSYYTGRQPWSIRVMQKFEVLVSIPFCAFGRDPFCVRPAISAHPKSMTCWCEWVIYKLRYAINGKNLDVRCIFFVA